MPELAELKITAEYINTLCNGLTFKKVLKNPTSKNIDLTVPFDLFKIKAQSRGKELKLTLIKESDRYSTELDIYMNMGMSGYFELLQKGQEKKHSQLVFSTVPIEGLGEFSLCFIDQRRFGRWKQGTEWSQNRGPDPTADFSEFQINIFKNLHKLDFDKPIHEVLLNQKYFNGIGNYLRAEILYRLDDVNPFQEAREVILCSPKLLDLCREIPLIAYSLNGGQLKDWKNPFGETPQDFSDFIKCYGKPNMARIVDSLNRTFWFDPKWIKHLEHVSN
jgi:endonuclease VIII-like 1